jgi:Tfp pilus assembly protein PilF
MKSVVDLYNEGEMNGAIDQSMSLLLDFPNSAALYNIVGAAKYSLGKFNEAIEAFERALSIKPDFAEAYNNVGNALRDQEKLKEASEAYEKALIINPKLYDTYISLGIVFKNQGKLAKAIKAYNEALTIQPDNIAGYVNIGIALTKQGKLGEGIEAFKQALSIEPDNAKTHYNIGNALKDQGKIIEAIEAYQKAVSIDPNFLHAHRSLSKIKKYTSDDPHIAQLQKLLLDERINDDSKCILSFTLAKIYEDLENFQKAFDHLYRANNIRKKLLNYSFDQDKNLFKQLKNTQAALFENSLKSKKNFAGPMPIFILGMPRSGTTLVEQIVSSHSQVTGGGELAYISEYGSHLVIDPTAINKAAISEFRTKYLSKLANLQNKNPQITDKMPLNFRFIPLICASLPEAKIIHVQRNAVATCWSNYKQYFPAKGLGYCHDLSDVASYYHLYNDLMNLWQLSYGDRIYNLNYDKLTEEQEIETRKLLEYLDLNWENSCLFPELNTRSVRTASQQQVRQEVFRGSSQFWQKYEQNIAGAFDSLFYL